VTLDLVVLRCAALRHHHAGLACWAGCDSGLVFHPPSHLGTPLRLLTPLQLFACGPRLLDALCVGAIGLGLGLSCGAE